MRSSSLTPRCLLWNSSRRRRPASSGKSGLRSWFRYTLPTLIASCNRHRESPLRPQILFPLFAAVTSLPGIGPRFGKLLEKLCGPHVVSLLWHLPTGLVDRSAEPALDDAVEGVNHHRRGEALGAYGAQQPPPALPCLRVNDTGALDLVFFKAQADYLKKILPVGELRVVSGRIERYGRTPNMVHPDYILPVSRRDEIPRFEPVYPMTAGLPPKVVVKAVRSALEDIPDPAEWADAHLVKRHDWPDWDDAVRAVHNPKSHSDLDPRRRRPRAPRL